jgi:hypothetical protein
MDDSPWWAVQTGLEAPRQGYGTTQNNIGHSVLALFVVHCVYYYFGCSLRLVGPGWAVHSPLLCNMFA